MRKISTLLALGVFSTAFAAPHADPMKMVLADEKPIPPAVMRHMGGFIIQPGSLKGHVGFFNGQTRVPGTVLDPIVNNTMKLMHLAAKAYPQMRRVTPANAAATMDDVDCQAAVFLVDDPDLPVLLIAPEEKWAIVNVGALAADKPDAEKLARRVRKEVWRGFAHACGAGASSSQHCVMNPCYSIADLDAFDSDMISMEPFMERRDCLPKMGLSPYRKRTYVQACKEGWAPAPTNEAQRVIMEKVKNGTINDKPKGRGSTKAAK